LVVDVGVPVTIGGLQIRSGDLLHGDGNGLLVVPAEIAANLPQRALEIQAEEAALMELLAQEPLDIDAVRRRFGQPSVKRGERSLR
jgi:regulator of RNase E activity RraA